MVKNQTAKKKLNSVSVFDIVVAALVVLVTAVLAYPLYFTIMASFSPIDDVASGKTLLWFSNFTVESYKNIIQETRLWIGYRNTIIYTVLGTLYNLVLTIPTAYVLTKKDLPFRKIIIWMFFITMFIGGGLIPNFLLRKNLHLLDNPLVMILGVGVSAYNLIICRQYFSSSIPPDLREAAYIDGAGDWKTFIQIYLPLSKPILAVMALYYGVGHWNSYMDGVMYLTTQNYFTLQQMVRIITQQGVDVQSLLEDPTLDAEAISAIMRRYRMARAMKYSLVFISSAPMLIAYPFIQKYFTKGVMLGSLKG